MMNTSVVPAFELACDRVADALAPDATVTWEWPGLIMVQVDPSTALTFGDIDETIHATVSTLRDNVWQPVEDTLPDALVTDVPSDSDDVEAISIAIVRAVNEFRGVAVTPLAPDQPLEFDARDLVAGAQRLTTGQWEVSYGEIWSGGDLAIMSVGDPEPKTSSGARVVATLVSHDDEASDEDVANAELLARAPRMLALLQRLALLTHPLEDHALEFDTLQDDAVHLLQDLARGWAGGDAEWEPSPCDYTADGTDDGPPCGRPAIYAHTSPDRDYADYYCAQHRPDRVLAPHQPAS